MNLSNFFNPKSIAVIGASPNKDKVGYSLVKNLLGGSRRKIYPVNPAYKKILNLTSYTSVLDIKNEIDLALIALRADIVPQVLEECGKKKISNVIIISSGFKEIGRSGLELEEKIKTIAKKYKITLLGPNCLGIIDTQNNFNASFAPEIPLKGSIAFVSQSGALGAAMLDWAKARGIGFSKFISLGNEADLTEIEFLEYLASDKNTKAIMLYLEKISDGKKFMRLAKQITRKKSIVILKAGRSNKGLAAVASHTGSLAPEDSVFAAACKQSGVITVESIRQFFSFAKLFHMGIYKPLKQLAVLTNGGGPSVVAADLIDLSKSLELATLKNETKNALKKVLPPMAAVNNPIDIIGDALSDRYASALKILVNEKNINAVITILTPQMMTQAEETAKLLGGFSKKKPILPVFIGGQSIYKALLEFKKNGLVNFGDSRDIVEILDVMAAENKKTSFFKTSESGQTTYKMLGFEETKKLLSKYSIAVEGEFVKTKNELSNVFNKFNNLVAIKIVSPNVIHKTEFRAVKLNIKNLDEAEKAWDEIVNSIKAKLPNARVEGMVVQKMVNPHTITGKDIFAKTHSPFGVGAREIIIGMKRDKTFGPVIVFGMGGIFTEALKDVSSRIAPVTKSEAKKMIEEIKGYPILKGLRGEKPVDFEKLENLIIAVSKLSLEHLEIQEIDLNPVMASENEAKIIDARVITE
ncbi:MAG: acetate--CoA ligase family protein [Patescibacteria group bacterium]|nr:acetate--CoA ligase family protein [Patescibacteria group bacterium]